MRLGLAVGPTSVDPSGRGAMSVMQIAEITWNEKTRWLAPRFPVISHLGKFIGGTVLSYEIVRMWGTAEKLPVRQSWVGELRSRNGLISMTVVLYGVAGLTVICRHLLSELG